MAKQSSGILLYKFINSQLQLFLVHPGGPFFKNKDEGSWSVPKGEFTDKENAFDAALREFREETGQTVDGHFIPLEPVIQKGGKKVFAWAVEGDIDHENIISNVFEIEWPPRSGKRQKFPEADKAEWFDMETARIKINPAQVGFIDDLLKKLLTA